jgi:hypothetical protein
MTDLDQLLAQAKAAALYFNCDAFRRSSAAEARAYGERFDRAAANDNGRAEAICALLQLMTALSHVAPEARENIAGAMNATVDAIREDRAAHKREEIASRPVKRHWTEGAAS